MWPLSGRGRKARTRQHHQRGFTLFETVLVIGTLALVSVIIAAIQPRVFATQTTSRDEFVGVELMRACAERLLAVRRQTGYGSVTSTLCNGMGGVGGFASNPSVTLTDAGDTGITTCSSATCTATISITKSAGPAAALRPLTLQLSAY